MYMSDKKYILYESDEFWSEPVRQIKVNWLKVTYESKVLLDLMESETHTYTFICVIEKWHFCYSE